MTVSTLKPIAAQRKHQIGYSDYMNQIIKTGLSGCTLRSVLVIAAIMISTAKCADILFPLELVFLFSE